MEIKIKIDTCTKCKHCSVSRDYTSDSFEYVERWDCELKKRKGIPTNIRRYVDWSDHSKFVPTWCPLIKHPEKY